jgi:hypothetical protein
MTAPGRPGASPGNAALVLVVRERIRAGSEAEYDANERAIAAASRTLQAPHPYLALVDPREPLEIWWLTLFVSAAHRAQIERAYAQNLPLMEALAPLGARKQAFRTSMSVESASHQPHLGATTLDVTGARFVVVGTDVVDRPSMGAAFISDDGAWFVFAPTSERATAPAVVPVGRTLVIRPEWSHPDPAWVRADVEFWRVASASARTR